jgi:hypothetical protein
VRNTCGVLQTLFSTSGVSCRQLNEYNQTAPLILNAKGLLQVNAVPALLFIVSSCVVAMQGISRTPFYRVRYSFLSLILMLRHHTMTHKVSKGRRKL